MKGLNTTLLSSIRSLLGIPTIQCLEKDWEEFIYGLGLIGMNSD